MAKYPISFSILFLVIGQISEVLAKKDILYVRNFNTWDAISGVLSQNWTKNQECLSELNAVKSGLEKDEEWALRVVDSWGNFPPGVLDGNFFEAGSFSECFHIERNGSRYKTQYCIGHLHWASFITPRHNISIGLCLPASCAAKYLEFAVNGVIHNRANNVTLKIPTETCQLEESITDWGAIDFITIGLLGIVLLLMITSTGYDILWTVSNRAKYQPYLVFSVYTNGPKLFSCTIFGPSSGTIQCIEGIRVLLTTWVVCNHTYAIYKLIPLREETALKEYIQSYHSAIIYAQISVDIFFVIGGLLVSYKMFKLLKKDGKLNILSLYWQRYLRLTPLLAVSVLVLATIYRFFGNGPIWTAMAQKKMTDCQRYWWSSLLYIQNYVNPIEPCNGPAWYLCVDMQLFMISPILVYFTHRFKKITLTASLISILSCTGYMVHVYTSNDLRDIYASYYKVAYNPTHFRFPAWLIGFITGYILIEYPKGSIRIPKKVNLCAWMLSLTLILAIVFRFHRFYQYVPIATSLEHGLYDAFGRIALSISSSYMIFACVHSSGGPINKFLSLAFWQPLSRLTYAVYLIHYPLLKIKLFSMKRPPFFSEISAFQDFIFFVMLSFLLAIPFALAFELPIDAINKLSTGTKRPKIHIKSYSLENSEKFTEKNTV